MEELVDLLNANGEKIGVVEKSEAHKRGLWHRVVHIWILNSNRQLLIQKRSKQKSFYPNVWDVSVGGHVGAGENAVDASLREVFEEIGVSLSAKDLEFLFSFADQIEYNGVLVNEIADVFLVEKDIDISKLKLQKEEVSDAKWISLNDFFAQCFSSKFLPHTKGYEKLAVWFDKNVL